MFWMDAEMDGCEERANGVLVMEPLMELEMEEQLAPVPTIVDMEDCTDGKECILIDGEELEQPLTTMPHFPSRFAMANVCFIA
jgi:hypothetical protein